MKDLRVEQIHHLPNYTVDLAPFLKVSTKKALHWIGHQPIFIDISKEFIDEIYMLSDLCFTDYFDEVRKLAKRWELEFANSEEGAPWMNISFGIRDKRPEIHKKKDQKYYLQFCREFGEWVMKHLPSELSLIPPLGLLLQRLLEVEKVCQKIFMEKIEEIATQYPESTTHLLRPIPKNLRTTSCGIFITGSMLYIGLLAPPIPKYLKSWSIGDRKLAWGVAVVK